MKTLLEHHQFSELLDEYLTNPCFSDAALIAANPYKRYVRKSDLAKIDLTKPISIDEICSNKNLIINKLLLTIYEQDLLFLDGSLQHQQTMSAFNMFYDPYYVALGKRIRPVLEHLAFNFLKNEIEVIGNWHKKNLIDYFISVIAKQELEKSSLCKGIENSFNPMLSAKLLLIQMAPDFLSEASAMGRSLLGAFGSEQSELMKVFIDEYGYGVHSEKHSTLFEKTMISADLDPTVHYYYNDYLPTSLMLVNYFHFVCSNKKEWFKYLGALYYTEASIPHFNKQLCSTFKKCIRGIDTRYFDEHVHIDIHHRRMVLDKIISPSIDKYGDVIIDEILFGFESFKLLQTIADEDILQQIRFMELLFIKNIPEKSETYLAIGEKMQFNELNGEVTTAHLHSEDEFFQIENGEVTFYPFTLMPIRLQKNDFVFIPKGRLHSTIALSNNTSYVVQPIKMSEALYD